MRSPEERYEMLSEAVDSGRPDDSLAINAEFNSDFEVYRRLESLFAALRAAPASSCPPPLPARLGRYEIREVIGRGAFGTVCLATDPQLDRPVAIKVPHAQSFRSEQDARQFLDEAKLAARLKHPGIVTIHDAGQDQGFCFIVMEYVKGDTLLEASRRERRSFEWIVNVLAEVADALSYAHANGFIHRDLKPANILVDAHGHPHITDFGLAISEDVQHFRAGQVAGTPAYMSPEQVRGETQWLDGRTDIWSLGVILYELLTGRHPFAGRDLASCLDEIQNRNAKPPRQIDHSIPPNLEAVCLRCLSKNVTDRFSTAADLAEELRSCLPVPQSKWARRWRVTVTCEMIVIAALGIGIAVSLNIPRSDDVAERSNDYDYEKPAPQLLATKEPATEPPRESQMVASRTATDPKPTGPTASISESGKASFTTGPDAPPLAVAPFDAVTARKHQEACAKFLNLPVEFTNSVGMKLVLISPGEFVMGSPESYGELAAAFAAYQARTKATTRGYEGEQPAHKVRISKPFYLGAYEVTVGQFRQFADSANYCTDMELDGVGAWGPDPSTGEVRRRNPMYTWRNTEWTQTMEHPVVSITCHDADEFCQWLSQQEERTYRLPTEAEWEYACRAGTTSWYCNGNSPDELTTVGNVADQTAKLTFSTWVKAVATSDGYVYTAPVGVFQPNAFGLYDMHGNVEEWCADWYNPFYYDSSPRDDPAGPSSSGGYRVSRGGAWAFGPGSCRSATRNGALTRVRANYLGLRVALDVSSAAK